MKDDIDMAMFDVAYSDKIIPEYPLRKAADVNLYR
jgi:hypothetical protein